MIHAEWPSLGMGIFPYTFGAVHFRVSELKKIFYLILIISNILEKKNENLELDLLLITYNLIDKMFH